VCVHGAQGWDFVNLTSGLCIHEYVRHGRTKIISTKPLAPKPAGGVLGG